MLSGVLIGGAWPLILQSVRVTPNAITLEKEYIERNIAATKLAYNIDDNKVTYQQYTAPQDGHPADLVQDTSNDVSNARLLDPNLLTPTFIQRQQLQNFYSFDTPLSVDRYTIDGKTEDYVVAVREMNIASLAENQQTWINEHLVYTHGNGFVAAPASDISGASGGGSGYPNFTISDVGTGGELNQGKIQVDQPRIYYGQLGADYSIVGGEDGTNPREYDTDQVNYTYSGSGGVPVGNLFLRLVFATQYGEPNFLFSSELNGESKIIYKRDPVERVKAVAPFLTTDTKPYPAVVDGKILWIVDGYTTAPNYPYAQQVTLSDATNNSQVAQGAGVAQVNDQVSYIRNSVKATVDAYTGEVKLYDVDPTDPILKAWEGVFPGLIESNDQITPDLLAHFRYPQDLFEVQRSLLAKYQVTNGTEFYQTSGFWQVPNDPTAEGSGSSASQPPYYLQVTLPGQEQSRFELTSALTRYQRDNIGGYIAASSDPESYGELTVLRFPTNVTTPGPAQIQQIFRSAQAVQSQITLLGPQNVKYGNLLTLPLESGLLYVEPLYVQNPAAGARAYPQLNLVLVWYGGRVGQGSSIVDALQDAARNAPVTVPADDTGGGDTGTTPAATGTETGSSTLSPTTTTTLPLSTDARSALIQVDAALAAVEAAKRTGTFEEIGAAQDRLNAAIQNYLTIVGSDLPVTSDSSGAPPTTTG